MASRGHSKTRTIFLGVLPSPENQDTPRIHARTFVIAGEKDAGTPPAMSKAIAARIPGSRLAVIAGAAHLSAVEKPAEFNALVRDFLASP